MWGIIILQFLNGAILDILVDESSESIDGGLEFLVLLLGVLAILGEGLENGEGHLLDVVVEADFLPLGEELEFLHGEQDLFQEGHLLLLKRGLFIPALTFRRQRRNRDLLLTLEEPVLPQLVDPDAILGVYRENLVEDFSERF